MLRPFTEQDRADYIRFSKMFYNSDAVLHQIPEQYLHNTMDHILADSPYAEGYMFECEGHIAGYALLSFTYSAEVGGLVLLMEEAFILPEFQGRGLGSELFDFVQKKYGDRVRRLRLEVTKSNEGAIRLYQRMGFETLDYLQMVKDLDS